MADDTWKVGIGLMSGTSGDGIDAALVRISGTGKSLKAELAAFRTFAYDDEFSARLRKPVADAAALCRLDVELGHRLAEAARSIAEEGGVPLREVAFIGSHGHTMAHLPNENFAGTLQIGEPAVIAELTGVTVVSHFRNRDMAAGGQGAPLVPYADGILFGETDSTVACLNIGGIANVTLIRPEGVVLAFDTGPGNMPIDDAVRLTTKGARHYDKDGEIAARGQVDPVFCRGLLMHDYFSEAPPKSTGREQFGFAEYVGPIVSQYDVVNDDDLIASLTYVVGETIVRAIRNFVMTLTMPSRLIVSGGGVHNPVLMAYLRDGLPEFEVTTTDAFGWPADAKEAVAFAILANETLCGTPSNVPAVTGARRAVVLGCVTSGNRAGEKFKAEPSP